ncbi:hypothetical protein [Streptomyces murinus]|uniref:hypothetical protein n=1 Tax=Streptomyces murinus TaxID=33900 RepID=UPI00380FCA10
METDQQQLDLDAIEAIANAATPGDWFAIELPPNEHHKHPAHWVKTEYDDGNCTSSQVMADCPWRQADAEFIAAVRPKVAKAMAAEIRRLRAELAKVTGQRDYWHNELMCADARITELGRRTRTTAVEAHVAADDSDDCPRFEDNPIAPDLCAGCGNAHRWHTSSAARRP